MIGMIFVLGFTSRTQTNKNKVINIFFIFLNPTPKLMLSAHERF